MCLFDGNTVVEIVNVSMIRRRPYFEIRDVFDKWSYAGFRPDGKPWALKIIPQYLEPLTPAAREFLEIGNPPMLKPTKPVEHEAPSMVYNDDRPYSQYARGSDPVNFDFRSQGSSGSMSD